MGTVLILEPADDVRELFVRLVERLGHDARTTSTDDGAADAVIVEPADEAALARAHELRRANPELPIVCASIEPKDARVSELAPAAYLVKPIALAQLDGALTAALG